MAGNSNSGRKQEKPFRDALRVEIASAGDDNKALRLVAVALLEKAMSGDMQAIKELADRTDGKVAQQVDLGSPDGGPIEFITYYAPKPE